MHHRLLSYAEVARLAPSKHNTQPWAFVVQNRALEVWLDQTRRLPATDPSGREAVIACGAAVETACTAAAAVGVTLLVDLWPDGVEGPVARLHEDGRRRVGEHDRALLSAVSRRRTDRGPLDATKLPTSIPFVLQNVAAARGCSVRLIRPGGDELTLAHVVELADRQLARRPDVVEEVRSWTRSPTDPAPDGVLKSAASGPRASYAARFQQRDFSDPGVPALHDRPGRDAPLVAVVCTQRDTREDWTRAGRALMVMLLEITVAGGNASYLNQPLELTHTRELLESDLDLTGRPQCIIRLGAGGTIPATARRPAGDVVRHHRVATPAQQNDKEQS